MKETRTLYGDNLRKLCIDKKWYTRGNNEQYSRLLTSVDGKDNITTADIVEIAADILDKSETEYPLSAICYEIAKICNSFFE